VSEGDYYVTAPAAVSRNMPLPKVEAAGEKPYVVCSAHPDSGALCVAVTPRTFGGQIDVTPPAVIQLKGSRASVPIGLFGSFASISIDFDEPVEGCRVVAQSLLSDMAQAVTDFVSLSGCRLSVPGDLMFRLGGAGDSTRSIPAIVLRLIRRDDVTECSQKKRNDRSDRSSCIREEYECGN
jgi:hypothetical protein